MGNEEGARLYLCLAANKAKESMQMLKMGARMDVMATQIQANASNEELVNKIHGLNPILFQQSKNVNIEKINHVMTNFQHQMDEMNIASQLVSGTMDETMQDDSQDVTVDNMMEQ